MVGMTLGGEEHSWVLHLCYREVAKKTIQAAQPLADDLPELGKEEKEKKQRNVSSEMASSILLLLSHVALTAFLPSFRPVAIGYFPVPSRESCAIDQSILISETLPG